MKRKSTTHLVLSALFLVLGLVLPFLTGQIQQFGSMLLPMHIPVLLCGFVCGPFWGLAVGFITPLLRSLIWSMPPLFPMALTMAFELAAYGLLAGLLVRLFPKTRWGTFAALVVSMIGGRIVWGLMANQFYGMAGMPFGKAIFLAGAFVNAWPGILLQLIVIPPLVTAIRRLIR